MIRKQNFKKILAGDIRGKGKEEPSFDFIEKQPVQLSSQDNNSRGKPSNQENTYLKYKYLQASDKSGISLIEFDQEEDRDKEGVKLALTKYNPLFTYMFDKYSSKSNFKTRPLAQFNRESYLSEKQIKTAELIKFLRDHNIGHSIMSKPDLTTMIKLINSKMLHRYEDDALDYQGFVQFIVQGAIYFHMKGKFLSPQETGGKNLNQLTLGEMVDNLITWFRLAANSHGQPVLLFDCPDAVADPSKALKLKQINSLLAQKPTMPMPPGFYMAKEARQVKTYKIPDRQRMMLGEAKCIAIELFEEILSSKFEIHILEPQIEIQDVCVAKLQIAKYNSANNQQYIADSALDKSQSQTQEELEVNEKESIGSRIFNEYMDSEKSEKEDKLKTPQNRKQTTFKMKKQAASQRPTKRNQKQIFDSVRNIKVHEKQASYDVPDYFDIYTTENLLKRQNEKSKQTFQLYNSISHPDISANDTEIKMHRASLPVPPDLAAKYYRDVIKFNLNVNKYHSPSKNLREMRDNEAMLMNKDWSADMKVACYELQNIRPKKDTEIIRETAQVLEDVLQTVCGQIKSYPFTSFKIRNHNLKKNLSTAVLEENKESKIAALKAQKQEEQRKMKEEQEKQEKIKNLKRIKRAILLKEKIQQKNQGLKTNLVAKDMLNNDLKSIDMIDESVADKTETKPQKIDEIDEKEYKALLKKQLEISKKERELKKKAVLDQKSLSLIEEQNKRKQLAKIAKEHTEDYKRQLNQISQDQAAVKQEKKKQEEQKELEKQQKINSSERSQNRAQKIKTQKKVNGSENAASEQLKKDIEKLVQEEEAQKQRDIESEIPNSGESFNLMKKNSNRKKVSEPEKFNVEQEEIDFYNEE